MGAIRWTDSGNVEMATRVDVSGSWCLVYELVSTGEEWELKDPAGVSLMHASSKKDLLWNAVRVARAHVPSQLLVRGRDGQLQDEFTYAPVPAPPPL